MRMEPSSGPVAADLPPIDSGIVNPAGPIDKALRIGVGMFGKVIGRLPQRSRFPAALRVMQNMLRVTSCKREMRRYANEPWMKEVSACQDEVISFSPGEYYAERYRQREVSTWLHVPQWLYEEERGRNVENCLDIGCGYGTLAVFCERMLRCAIHCMNVMEIRSTTALAGKHGFDLRHCNVETDALPWSKKFEVIVFTEVLEHLNFNPVPTMRKIAGSMTPSGRLYLSTPDASEAGKVTKYYRHWREMQEPEKGRKLIDDHVYQYSLEELLEIVDMAGLKVARLAYAPGHVTRHFNAILVKKGPRF